MAQTLLCYVTGNGRQGSAATILILLILIFAASDTALGQPDPIFRLPAGTRIRLKLDAELNSRVASVDDTFLAFVAKPVSIRDAGVLPAGTQIEGRAALVRHAGGMGKNGSLDLLFETLTLNGRTRHIDGVLIMPLARPRNSKGSLFAILGGAAAGGVLGGAIGSAPGAAVGAAAGAGIGTAAAMVRRGRDARLKSGEEFEIELRSPVVLPVDDY